MAKFCSNCGSPLGEGIRFCPNCGTPVSDAPMAPINSAPVQLSPEIKVSDFNVEPDVVVGDALGVDLHCRLEINHLKGKHLVLVMLFYYAGMNYRGGIVLPPDLLKYSLDREHLIVADEANPPYDNTFWDDYKLFVPYDCLTLGNMGSTKIQSLYELYDASDDNNWVRLSRDPGPNFEIIANRPLFGKTTYSVVQSPVIYKE